MDKFQTIVSIVQTGIMLMAFLGALYFGFKQKEVSEKLSSIEHYNYEQTLLDKKVVELTAKKELRNITIEIIEMFGWSNQHEKELIENRSREERLELIKRINNLLYDGLDNELLVNNEEALSKWLQAINYLETYKNFHPNTKIVGTIVDEKGERKDDKEASEKFDKYMVESMGRTVGRVLEVHSKLGLSLSLMSMELSKKLKENSEKQN